MASSKDISSTLEMIANVLKEHVKFQSESEANVLALWIAMTYVMDHLEIAPFIWITSPEPMCGKSTVMRLLSVFCKSSQMASRITPAAVYRLIERDQPTLLIDEADRFLKGNNNLNGILNAGHARFEAKVIVNDPLSNGKHEPKEYPVWCAKAVAGIGDVEDTLSNRSIRISLRRKLITESVKPVRFNLTQQHEQTRKALAEWASTFGPVTEDEMQPVLFGGSDRTIDNWLTISIIAERIQNGWPERAKAAFEAIEVNRRTETKSNSIELLGDIAMVIECDRRTEWKSSDLYDRVLQIEDSDWHCCNYGKPITRKKFTQILKSFDIQPVKRANANVFYVSDLEEAFNRYLPPM